MVATTSATLITCVAVPDDLPEGRWKIYVRSRHVDSINTRVGTRKSMIAVRFT